MTVQTVMTFCVTVQDINEKLFKFQALYPKRHIIGTSVTDSGPHGYTVVITYELED